MSVGKLMQNCGLAALAAAIAVTAVPAFAQNRERVRDADRIVEVEAPPAHAMEARARIAQRADRGNGQRAERVDRRSEQRAVQVDRRSEQRAQQIDRRSEQRAVRVERQGDRNAAQAARQGNWGQARRVDRQSEQAARQIERRGDWRADRVERQGDARATQIERRGDRRAEGAQRWGDRSTQTDRNRAYGGGERDRNYGDRNRTYSDRDRNRTYDGRARDNDRRWSNNDGRWRDNDRRDHRRWDRRWRDSNRYDWQRYRSSNRVVFNIGTYYSPYRNYRYRRLGVGGHLDSLFFNQSYWINDPWQYRLPEVYGPYRWVRYYDDVLLVDIYSGEVVDVIHDFFWENPFCRREWPGWSETPAPQGAGVSASATGLASPAWGVE